MNAGSATVFEIAALAGHKSIDTTMRYGLPGAQDLQRVVEAQAD